jgi:hypothetical protein
VTHDPPHVGEEGDRCEDLLAGDRVALDDLELVVGERAAMRNAASAS